MNLLIPFVSGNRTSTRVRWRKYFPLKLFRTFTGKMTRGLSLQMVFSPFFVETLFHVETLSLHPMKQYIITTMLDVVLHCFCFVFAFALVSLHGD